MSAQITVHVAGSERSVEQGTTAGELFEGDRLRDRKRRGREAAERPPGRQ